MNLNWLYTAVSFIMLRWHDLFSFLGDRTFLGTNWDWVLSIIFLVITIRIILFPLFVKQIKSQRAMQALQPQLKELQEKHKGDRETLQREVMELYKREKANPLMGCLPIFLQVPVFISLFWILGRRLDPNRAWRLGWPDETPSPEALAHSHIELYGWTLDQYGSAAQAKLFNAPIAAVFYEVGWFERDLASHYAEMGTTQLNVMLVAGVLTVLMVVTTFLTSRQMVLKTGWATDPTQLMMQRLMVYGLPLMLLFSGSFFPISVIIYWVTNNLFSLGQQQWVLRKYPPPPTASGAKPATGPAAKAGGGARQPGKGGKGTGKEGVADGQPAIDGRKLAPKPGAKPSQAKRVPPKGIPPKAGSGAQSIPPKRPGSSPAQGQSGGMSGAKPAGKNTSKSSGSAAGKSSGSAAGKSSGNAGTPGGTAAGKGKGGSAGKGRKGSGSRTSSDGWPAPPPFEPRRGETDRLGRRSD